MTNENKVLACVDQSQFATHVTDYAAWAAKRMDAPLELLHVINMHHEIGSGEDHSGAIGFNAQEKLLSRLSEQDETRAREAREQGRLFLDDLRRRALAAGAPSVDVRLRQGEVAETLIEQEKSVRLLVMGRQGKSAQDNQPGLGRNIEHIVRALHRPTLAVTENFTEIQRVMITVDGRSSTRRGIELIANSPLLRGLPIFLMISGKQSSDALKQLEWATNQLQRAEFETIQVAAPEGDHPVPTAVESKQIDLLVMSAYNHSPLRNLLFGSQTSELLRSSKIPTLLLR